MRGYVVVIVLIIGLIGLWEQPARGVDATNGQKVFQSNCAPCHPAGGNLLDQSKSLKKDDLVKYDMFSQAAIETQVAEGKAPMPAFKEILDKTQIKDVAAYVLEQAEKGWQ